jgi:hypothetical protein
MARGRRVGLQRPGSGGNGWCSLQDAIKIRHRLTHPKTAADFILSDDELGTVSDGLNWFLTNLSALVDGMYADLTLI